MELLQRFAKENRLEQVEFCGARAAGEVLRLIEGCRFLVFPSECYEGFPMTIGEAFARGVPVVASRLGGMREIVSDGSSGALFEPGDPTDLARRVQELWGDVELVTTLGAEARRQFEEKYDGKHAYRRLIEIYRRAGVSV